jgi:zinc protease
VHPDNVIWVVVGDRGKIEGAIRQLGLGQVKLLDANGNLMP